MWGFYSQRKYVEPLANGATIITSFFETLPIDEILHNDMDEDDRWGERTSVHLCIIIHVNGR